LLWLLVSCFLWLVLLLLCFTDSSVAVGMLSCLCPVLDGNSYITGSRSVILRVFKVQVSINFIVYLHILRKSTVVITQAHDIAHSLYYVSVRT
jgi:hypothetical protein